MIQKLLLLLFILSIPLSATFSQNKKKQAKNVRIEIEDDIVKILYDLPALKNAKYDVQLKIKKSDIVPMRVMGEGTDMTPGRDLELIWPYANNDLTREDVVQMRSRIQVIAINKSLAPSKNYIKTGLGFGAAGLGLITVGSITMSNAKNSDEYIAYKEIYNPDDPIWKSSFNYDSRDELYQDINDKYNNGQRLLIAGGVIIVTGAIIFYTQLKKYNSKLSQGNAMIYPVIDISPAQMQQQPLILGAGCSLQF